MGLDEGQRKLLLGLISGEIKAEEIQTDDTEQEQEDYKDYKEVVINQDIEGLKRELRAMKELVATLVYRYNNHLHLDKNSGKIVSNGLILTKNLVKGLL
jgi:hypothetical protein